MKYLVTFFALTIFASSSAFACSTTDLKSCKTKADCEKLGGYEFSTGSCLIKTTQASTTDCSMVNGTSMAKSIGTKSEGGQGQGQGASK